MDKIALLNHESMLTFPILDFCLFFQDLSFRALFLVALCQITYSLASKFQSLKLRAFFNDLQKRATSFQLQTFHIAKPVNLS